MSTNEIHPALDASADEAPHDEWCSKLMAKVPPEQRGGTCLCQAFASVRAAELLEVGKILHSGPDLATARTAVTTRLLQHMMVALLPRAPR